jgi:hypothetical protein
MVKAHCHTAALVSTMVRMRSAPAFPVFSGKLAATGLLALALAAALGAGWYYYRLQRRPLRLWGTANMWLIVLAPRVWATCLVELPEREGPAERPARPREELLTLEGQTYVTSGWKDISRARGLSNVRHLLLNDHAYDWARAPTQGAPVWRYALRFASGGETCTLVVDSRGEFVRLAPSGKSVCTAPAAAGLRAFLEEQLGQPDHEPAEAAGTRRHAPP